jgi:hypothetical protein
MSITELSNKIFEGSYSRESLEKLLKKYVVMKENPPEKVVEFKLTKIKQ